MEVACGEYGDMVPPLVVAVQNNHCALYQQTAQLLKLTNCDKSLAAAGSTGRTSARLDHNTLTADHDVQACDDTATAAAAAGDSEPVDDSSAVDQCVSLLDKRQRRVAVPTLVLANGDISCDVTLLKDVCRLRFSVYSALGLSGSRQQNLVFYLTVLIILGGRGERKYKDASGNSKTSL